MINFFLLVKNFLNAKWIFQRPEKKKIVVYGFGHSNILFNYIKKKESAIYYNRWEEINFFIIYFVIINYGFNNFRANYKKIFFTFVKPKIAITLMSNYVAFYKLKNEFPNILTIAVQESLGNPAFTKLLKEEKKKTLSCDYFFFFSDVFKKKYKKYIDIKKKSFVIGSFKNNFYNHKISSTKKIVFISKCNKGQESLNEIILLKHIIRYLIINRQGKLDICLKSNHISTIEYFKKNLAIDHVNIIPKKNSYLLMKNYENIIFTDSNLGYECLAKGKKVISFGLGSLNRSWCVKNGFPVINKFGYPNKFPNEGFFWSNSSSEQKINKLLQDIMSMSQSTFNKKIKIIKKKIMFFDKKNTKFQKLLMTL
jgi:surface carbohydrate biosynthesis protein